MSVNPFANAQECCGGVDTNEIDETTMESRLARDCIWLVRSWMEGSAAAIIFNLPGPAV